MAVSRGFQEFILDLLGPLEPMARRMFSGVGLFHGGVMFGLLVRDAMYFRVDDTTRERFERAGSRPFSYMRGDREVSLSAYYAGAGGPVGQAGRVAAMGARRGHVSAFGAAAAEVEQELLRQQLRMLDLPGLVQVLAGIEECRARIAAEIRQLEEVGAVGQIDGCGSHPAWFPAWVHRRTRSAARRSRAPHARLPGVGRSAINALPSAGADLLSRGMV